MSKTNSRYLDRRNTLKLFAGVGLAAGFAGLMPREGLTQDLSGTTLRFSVEKGGDYLLLQSAGLADTPYTLDPIEFASGNLVVEALKGSAIELGMMSETPIAFAAATGTNIRVVGVLKDDLNLQAVIVPKDSAIASIEDLKGKRVGFVRATTTHYFLAKMLAEVGLGFSDIEANPLSPADGLAAFRSGSLDAWAIFGLNIPYSIKDGAKVLKPAQGYLSGHTFYVSTPAALADEAKVAAISDFLFRLRKAYAWREANLEKWADIHSAATGIPRDLDYEVLKNATRRRDLFPVTDEEVESAQDVADTFLALAVLPNGADVSPLFDRRFEEALIRPLS